MADSSPLHRAAADRLLHAVCAATSQCIDFTRPSDSERIEVDRGNLVLGELLPGEARRVGKDIDNVCAKEATAAKEAGKDAKKER